MPDIGFGSGFTVTTTVTAHPEPSVYEIVVVPALTPVTLPKLSTEPIAGLVLLHVPPVVASVSAVVKVAQTLITPVRADGSGFTVTVVTV